MSDIRQRVERWKIGGVDENKLENMNFIEPELIQILSDYFGYLKNAALRECLKRFGSGKFDVSLVCWSTE